MKVVALLEDSIASGGGFNQALNAIVQMARVTEGNFEFAVLTLIPENVPVLEGRGIRAHYFKPSFLDKIVAGFAINEFTRRVQVRLKVIGPLERKLISMGCDIAYFVAPSARPASLQCLNYIATVWDDCHRDFPEFPEVRTFGEFQRREYIYKNYLSPAYFILVDSEQLRDRLQARYGIDKAQMIVMPFAPNPMLGAQHSLSVEDALAHYSLEPGYFFYPDQFWAHNNNVRIIEALAISNAKGEIHKAIFVGGDQGNLGNIKKTIRSLGLDDQVTILGFVPPDHLRGLYLGCAAVVMPTYFGPTNLPPLEAWQLGRPLIYSRHLAEQVGNAAVLIDPDDPESIALALNCILIEETAKENISLGKVRL